MQHISHIFFILTIILVAPGCNQEVSEKAATGAPAATAEEETRDAATLPADFFLAEAPTGAVPLSQVRANSVVGETIAFTGYIGGRAEPFTEDRAIFLVTDSEKAPACGEECQTPWDARCVSSEIIAANTATVQLVDDRGKTRHLNLKGFQGLVPGIPVAVMGKVRTADDAVFIVDAAGIAIESSAK